MSEHFVWRILDITKYHNQDIKEVEILYDEIISGYNISNKRFCKALAYGIDNYIEATQCIIKYFANK